MREGVDLGVLARVSVDAAETCEGVLAINVHGARATDTFSARAPKSEGRVYFVLDLDERIQHLCIRAYGDEHVRLEERWDEWIRAMGPVWLRSIE